MECANCHTRVSCCRKCGGELIENKKTCSSLLDGDIVKILGDVDHKDWTGIIARVHRASDGVVGFEALSRKPDDGHNLSGACPDGYGRWISNGTCCAPTTYKLLRRITS